MKILTIILCVAASSSAFGAEFHVAPILFVDETRDFDRSTTRAQNDLLESLWSRETGVVVRFSRLADNRINPPQSLTDAVTVCRNERLEYLLYGYVTRKDHSVQMEIRLFDYENRRVMRSFFGMDDGENYERMVDDMSFKILDYIGSTFNLELIPQRPQKFHVSVPAFLGYWTPMQKEWTDVMFGTVTAASGVEFVPTDNLFTLFGFTFFLATGLEIRYRLGIGDTSRYEAYDNTICFTVPVRLNAVLTERHGVFFGTGFVYFLEIFTVADKYADSKTDVYANTGMNVCFGYSFLFNDKITFFFRNDFDFLFNEKSLVSYSPSIGVNIRIHSDEVKRRW